MALYAISDLHLSFGVPDKKMDIFGEVWNDHPQKIMEQWFEVVGYDDIVIVAGDISWASTIDQALPDLDWLDQLPGTKIIIKGNHDYWWSSYKKVCAALPDSIIPLQSSPIIIDRYLFMGSRMWDRALDIKQGGDLVEGSGDKLFQKELHRLETQLLSLPKEHREYTQVGITHFPPGVPSTEGSEVLSLLHGAGAEHVVFGHLHGETHYEGVEVAYNGMQSHLTSCDYLGFRPKKID
ncbi:MAG: metallophosphoesterase [Fibrobacterales bacterium]